MTIIHYIPGVVAQIVKDGKITSQRFEATGDDYYTEDGKMVDWTNTQLKAIPEFPIQLLQPYEQS